MKCKLLLAVLLALGLCLALMLSLSQMQARAGGIRYVALSGNCGGATPCYETVQAAVDAAQPGDEIRIAAGVYTDTHVRPAPAGYPGPAVITQVVYLPKAVALRGGYTNTNWTTPDPVAHPTVLNAQGQGRVLFIAETITATVEGLQITGGYAAGLGGLYFDETLVDDVGGGIYVLTATITLRHNMISDNAADRGGGLFLWKSGATLSDNTISDNRVPIGFEPGYGGGLYIVESTVRLSGNTVADNRAGVHGQAAGIYMTRSTATLSDNTIRGNLAPDSGGMELADGEYTLRHNTIISNTAYAGGGGGVALYGSTATLVGNDIRGNLATSSGGGLSIGDSTATLSGNLIRHNSGGLRGGGLFLGGSQTTLVNNVIGENRTSVRASGLYVEGGVAHLLHNTIAKNEGGDGSGLHIGSTASDEVRGVVALTNTILVSHTVGITVTANHTATLNGVLWFGNGTNTGGAGAITVMNASTGDPIFAGDGYHLMSPSAAIDRGVMTGVMTDIDADPRVGIPDLGADEVVTASIWRSYLPLVLRFR